MTGYAPCWACSRLFGGPFSIFLFLRKQMGGSRGGIPRNSDQNLKQSEAYSAVSLPAGPEVPCFTPAMLMGATTHGRSAAFFHQILIDVYEALSVTKIMLMDHPHRF